MVLLSWVALAHSKGLDSSSAVVISANFPTWQHNGARGIMHFSEISGSFISPLPCPSLVILKDDPQCVNITRN